MNCKHINIFIALVLSWNMSLNQSHAEISGYQIFAYKETSSDIPRSDLWKEIGNVNALPLPMACSLTKVNIIFINLKIT